MSDEEAEVDWSNAPEAPILQARILNILRFVALVDGQIPIDNATEEELAAVFRYRMNNPR